jgi:propionate catabolism operon transcriptional regulator
VLQEREITRVGATAPIPVDVRVIAATHQPLHEMIGERRFRQDLYYRINTLRLALPPLRERREDVALLAQVLVERCLQRLMATLDARRALAPLMPRLTAYGWPGNVRELENLAERIAVFLSQFDRLEDIRYDELRHECPELFADQADAPDMPHIASKSNLREVLAAQGGNRQKAAKQLGVSRSTLWRWIREMEGGAAPG